jgi:hypothetical protein
MMGLPWDSLYAAPNEGNHHQSTPDPSTSSNRKWNATTVLGGQIAVNVMICQPYCTILSTGLTLLYTTITAIITKQNTNVNLNLCKIFGISSKNVVFSASLLVAPHDMSMLSMWHAIACKTCMETPPRKMF